MTTIDEAALCPKCQEVGQQGARNPGPRRSTVYTYTCRNERCVWFGSSWIVQVNADGSIPERGMGPKEHPALTPDQEAIARRNIESLAEAGDPGAREFLERS